MTRDAARLCAKSDADRHLAERLEREGALKVSPDLIEVVNVDRLEEIAFGSKKG